MPGGRFIRIYADITERKRTEAALTEHQTNLERLVEQRTAELVLANERLQVAVAQTEAEKRRVEQASRAKTAFLNAVGHDILNPLNAILGYAGLVIANARDRLPPLQYANLENVVVAGRELKAMVDDLRDYARAERGTPTAFDLGRAIRECLATAEPRIAEKGLQIACDLPPDLPPVVQDQGKLRRILANLLTNAVKNTEDGRIGVSVCRRGDAIEVAVSDTGVGVAAEDLERIFEEGEQVERGAPAKDGLGLGLAICRRFAALMGGAVGVRSRLGEGSVFTLTFPALHPLAAADEARAGEAAPPPPDPAIAVERPATILVVDDAAANRDYLVQLLGRRRHRVITAADGREAITMVRAERPDIVLMDLSLPLVDGWEATRRIKADPTLRSIPIVAVTARAGGRDRAAFAAAGGDGFLAKPVEEAALSAILWHHLGAGRGASP